MPWHKHFPSLCPHHLCDGPIGQSMSHDQAQVQCGREVEGLDTGVTIIHTGNSRLLLRKAERLFPG